MSAPVTQRSVHIYRSAPPMRRVYRTLEFCHRPACRHQSSCSKFKKLLKVFAPMGERSLQDATIRPRLEMAAMTNIPFGNAEVLIL